MAAPDGREIPATAPERKDSEPLHVLICGAGPAGLLLAHYLLAHGNGRFKVSVWDVSEDAREACKRPPSIHRGRWSIGICPRGRATLQKFQGLEEAALKQKSAAMIHRLMLCIGTRRTEVSVPSNAMTFSIDRLDLCEAMLETLLERYQGSGLLEMNYFHRCLSVDLRKHTATFQHVDWVDDREVAEGKKKVVSYDLIVGADGLRSRVRDALVLEPGKGCDVSVKDATSVGQVVHVPIPEGFDKNAGHIAALANVGGTMNCIVYTSSDVTLNVVLYYFEHDPPKEWVNILQGGDAKAVRQFLHERIPWLEMPEDACQQILTQRPTRIKAVKASSYHSSSGQAVLIGDAAHCTFPFLGQGCNASLVDSIVLGRLLCEEKVRADDRHGLKAEAGRDKQKVVFSRPGFLEKLPGLLEVYSALQVPEGHALVDLSEAISPLDGRLRVWEIVRELARQFLSTWLPWLVMPAMRQRATYTLDPFSTLRKTYSAMVERVLRSNAKVKERTAEQKRFEILSAAGVV